LGHGFDELLSKFYRRILPYPYVDDRMVSAMRIVYMGTPEFAVPALERLACGEHRVEAVYAGLDKPAGRGREVVPPPVKKRALELGLEVRQTASLRSRGAVAALEALQPDVIIVASFGLILPPQVLAIPPYGCINLHPSLLPRYRGPTPIPTAILAGDDITGASIMLMDEGIDSGPVLAQRTVPIEPVDTTRSLTDKLAVISADLLMETLPLWLSRSIAPRPQRREEATYTKMLGKNDGKIDWHLPAVELWRRVRAFYPWPAAFTSWNGKGMRILEALPQTGQLDEPGRVLDLGCGEVGVQAGEGILKLVKVQLEGKREMPIEEFVRGQRSFAGSMLPG
jgi:methionyl-tRNA formyltransferase